MKLYIMRLFKLFFGLMLYAVGIVFTMKGNLGYAPWEVFHAGLGNAIGMKIGTVSILIGAVLIIITLIFGEKMGLGTIFNMIFIGLFMNIILSLNIIPQAENIFVKLTFLIGGLFIISFGSYFYISSEFGAGPRDSLMVVVRRKTGFPIGVCRGTIESLAVLIGWLLGGKVGIGTIIAAFGIGFCIQTTFKLLKFEVTKLNHENFKNTFSKILKNITKTA